MVTTSIKTQFVLKEGAISYRKIKEFFEPASAPSYPNVLVDSIIVESEDYPLQEVLPETLRVLRDSGQPGFVLKKDGKLLYATHPHLRRYQSKLDCIKGDRTHKCNDKYMMCQRLSALPDAKGGCAKIRDKYYFIEDYDFITEGYEFFNINQDSFVVLECRHWVPNDKANTAPRVSKSDATKRKLALAQYVWPEVETISDLRKKVQK